MMNSNGRDEMMKCPKCQHEIQPADKFCRECGTKLPPVCPNCGNEVSPQDKFCAECGTQLVVEGLSTQPSVTVAPDEASQTLKLEDLHSQLQSFIPDALTQKYLVAEQQATGENRLITSLFADISGFTSLSETQSSESIFHLMQDCFKQLVSIVAGYEGSISGFRGDGLLALFGAPILHENDAERAILAAMEMRHAMQEKGLEVKIGLNTAMMTVGEIQTQLHKEYTAYGTDVNLAKRLQEAADPGQILVGNGTHRLTRRMFDFQVLQELSLRGFSQLITAYVLQQVKDQPEKLRGIEGLRARMIGREHEFADLKDAADMWLAGQGQIVAVIGEAGIGKSRLVSELKEYLNSREEAEQVISILEGRCVSIGQPISYWPFIDILSAYFGLSEADDEPTRASKVTVSITHLMPQGADETLPLLGNVLSIRFGDELDDRLKFASPEQIRHQTLMRLRDLLETEARAQPLLLILEDLHWGDDLSLDLISLLMDELTNTPLMLLCVYRPEREHRVWQLSEQARRKCLDRYTELRLKPLSTIESRKLVESLLTIENLPEATKEEILTKSEGNPFFIEEVIRSLIEQEMIYRDDDHWRARDEIATISVPDTIQSVLLARVDRLQTEARYVLQCASVIGRLFRYRLLRHISHQEEQLDNYLTEFEQKELVFPERTVPEVEYAFKHAFTQEATYAGILEQQRREFHHQVAEGIERLYHERLDEYYEELAHHYSRSGNANKAVEYLLKAGNKAKESYANEVASQYYKDALLRLPELEEEKTEWKLVALEGLGQIHALLGEHGEAITSFQEALSIRKARGDTPQNLARLYHEIAGSLRWQEWSAEAIQMSREGLRLLGDTVCVERALLYRSLSDALHDELRKDYKLREEAQIYTEKCWELLQQLVEKANYFPELPALWDIRRYSLMWTDEQKIAHYKEGIQRCRKHGDELGLIRFFHTLGDIYQFQLGDPKLALKWYQCSIEHAREAGAQNYLMYSLIDVGALFTYEVGRWQEAENYLLEGIKLAEVIGKQDYVHGARTCLGIVYSGIQRWSDVLEIIQPHAEELVCSQMPFGIISKMKFSQSLMMLEKAWSKTGNPEAFPAFCERLQKQYPEAWQQIPLLCFQPEPIQVGVKWEPRCWEAPGPKEFQSVWQWQDESGRSRLQISPQSDEIDIHPAKASLLCPGLNMQAPRLLLPIPGAFAVEAWVSPAEEKPKASGGLLLWKNEDNFLCLAHEGDKIIFAGHRDGKWYLFGQGLWQMERTQLRLEWSGKRVVTYCSMDGRKWFSLGESAFSVEGPVQFGVFAANWRGFPPPLPLTLSDAALQFSGIRIGHPLEKQ